MGSCFDIGNRSEAVVVVLNGNYSGSEFRYLPRGGTMHPSIITRDGKIRKSKLDAKLPCVELLLTVLLILRYEHKGIQDRLDRKEARTKQTNSFEGIVVR